MQVFLRILSGIYYLVIELRNFFYKIKLFGSYKLDAKVISVGNITWGGTGKTSFVYLLAKKIAERKQSAAILIRGYKRKGKRMMVVNLKAKDIHWQEVGDEAYLLATQLDSVPIIVGKDRVKSGKEATDKYSANYLILDDGFQHRRLTRDIDIVMIDAQDPFGNGWLLPAGKLREPIKNIRRANILVLNRANQADDRENLMAKLKEYNPNVPIVETEYVVEKIYGLQEENSISPNEIKHKKILAFCGIGNPKSFRRTLRDLGTDILDFMIYPDHYVYQEKDLQRIGKQALDKSADFILTTEKDKIRLPILKDLKLLIYIVKIESKITSGETKLWDMIYG